MWKFYVIDYLLVIFYINNVAAAAAGGEPSSNQQHIDALTKHLQSRQCHENVPNISECFQNLFQYLLNNFKTGFSATTVPIMDPLQIPKTNFIITNNIIQGQMALQNVNVTGLTDHKLKSVKYKSNNSQIMIVVEGVLPKMEVKGNIIADVLLFSNAVLKPKGVFDLLLTNLSFKIKEVFDLYERAGHTYMKVKSIQFHFELGDMILKADSLIEDQLINQIIIEFINTNWRQFYKIWIDEMRAQLEALFIQIVNQYWPNVPYDVLIIKDLI